MKPGVLVLVDRLDEILGGGERTALRLATELGAEGFEVWACTTRDSFGWPLEALREAGVHHLQVSRSKRGDLAALRPLWHTLRSGRIDIVHAHMFGSNVWGTVLGRAARVPVVIAHEHSWSYEGQLGRRLADTMIGRAADAFIAVSRADAELMVSREHVPRGKIHVIPSAFQPRENGGTGDLRREFSIPPDAPIIGTVALLRPVKRLELLVEAFARVLREVPEAWLVIVGEGESRPSVEAAIERFGVGARTTMTGMREDVDTMWRSIDVAAMTSDREGTPVAALEALHYGVPMVAPAVGGIPDIFEGGGGVLVPPGDVEALSRELAALLRDPERRRTIGAAGRAHAREFSAERQVERCVTLYRELLAGPRARRRIARRREED